MNVDFARPDVTELVFNLFGRSVHPELFQIYAESEVHVDNYTAFIRICDAGHIIDFRYKDRTISEITAARNQLLPQRKQLLQNKLKGHKDEAVNFDEGIEYQVSFQLEKLDPEVFLNIHEELSIDCNRAHTAHRFPPGNRLSPGPLSLIQTDISPRSLLIHAFHTFPENCAVVKTQSLFEI